MKRIWFRKPLKRNRGVPINKESLPLPETRKRRRERALILFLAALFCGLTYFEIHLSSLSQKLPFVNSIFFFGLVNFNVALLLFLAFLIFRNIAKVFSETRGQFVGKQLKTKLVVAFLTFAFVPTILLFLVSVFYINSSFDKWFSLKIGSVLQDSLEVTDAFYTTTKKKDYFFGQKLATLLEHTPASRRRKLVSNFQKEMNLDAIEFYPSVFGNRVLAISHDTSLKDIPHATLEFLHKGLVLGAAASTIHQFSDGNLIRCIIPVRRQGRIMGAVVVSSYVPLSLVSKMDGIATAFEDYRDVNPLKYPIKSIYLIILILVTLLIFFGACWFGFHLARQLSTPLELLGRAAENIAHGKYQTVDVRIGSQEIFQLVESFNKMSADLASSEDQLRTHTRYIEVILSNISAGVVSVDRDGQITTINAYAAGMLDIDPEILLGRHFEEALPPDYRNVLRDMLAKLQNHKAHSIQKEIQLKVRSETLVLHTTLSLLRDEHGRSLGYVLVFDDLTKLINAQRAAAWREVARRIAHEIKNPLTPIRLSAERLHRKFVDQIQDPAFEMCTKTIIQQVDDLKNLVNEFSSFARLPQAKLSINNLNDLVREVSVLYQEGHKTIQFTLDLDPYLPEFDMDREQIKRVLINLLENAVAALQNMPQMPYPRVAISTFYDSVLRIARCAVIDNGPGIPSDIRDRIFEPYFSTKDGGTGLGLAICKRIIDDHNGFIRVNRSQTPGAEFTIELPVVVRADIMAPPRLADGRGGEASS